MSKFTTCCFFLSGNFIYQFFLDNPDYLIAVERTYFMGIAMLFMVFWPTFKKL